MSYSAKEIYLTIQGEGFWTGRTAVFCRFSGCNLWSGLDKDRANAICKFCDTYFVGTNFVGGGKYKTSVELVEKINDIWGVGQKDRFVVLTGGEPLLQVDEPLIDELHRHGYMVAVETNGTIKCLDSIDWVTVSPKEGSQLVQMSGDELKLAYPQDGNDPSKYDSLDFKHHYIQPIWGKDLSENVRNSIDYCLDRRKWKLSLQTHKYIGMA